ncbi:MAG: EAL domain-containing protein [Nitriliruptoraceae bacterium]
MESIHDRTDERQADRPLPLAADADPQPDLTPLLAPDRLSSLVRLGLRTQPPVTALERLCRLASRMLDADAASVTIVEDVQTTVAADGLELAPEKVTVPLDESFCARAMVTRRVLPITDASEHPWVKHTAAAREGRIVGYLGAPLFLSNGNAVGALCVFSDEPRAWTELEEQLLTDLAASTSSELELRLAATDLEASLAATVAARDQLAYAATHDGLTELANRTLLVRTIEQALELPGDPALLYLDLDGFKPINDRYGHAAGDALLIAVADRLRAGVPPGALVARLGGDEFAVLCPASSPRLVRQLAEELHAAVVRPIELDGHTVAVGASCGLATISMLAGSEVTADALLSAADAAMYEAKRDPEQRVRTFDADIRARYERRCAVRAAMREALEAGAVEVAFEPDLDLATGGLHGVQVTPRLATTALQHVDARELVAAAQELGQLGVLAGLVLERTSAILELWQQDGVVLPPRVWVWTDAGQLTDLELHRQLTALQARTETTLGVQLHERALTDPTIVAALRDLRAAGLEVAVERFGAGTASFASLKQVQLDLLRIDPSFVDEADVDASRQAAIQAFVQLADALEASVVADGVSSEPALHAVARLGCRVACGPAMVRALPDGPALRRVLGTVPELRQPAV